MIRLIHIEFLKLKNTRFFWLFSTLFMLVLISIPLFSRTFLDFLTKEGASFNGIGANDLPLFDFVDIWQNLAYIYKWPIILLAFIPVISLANEYRYGTIKQNVIDGLSRRELILSKVLFSAALSIAFGIIVLLIGLIMGFTYSPVTGLDFILKNIEFVPALALVIFGYQIFCLLVTLIIKKSGITILLLLFYFFALEAFAYGWLSWEWKMPYHTSFLPLRGMANVIPNPFPKYAFQEVQTSVGWKNVLVTLAHISTYTFLLLTLFKKRDIR